MTPNQKWMATISALRKNAEAKTKESETITINAEQLIEFILSPACELGEHGLAHLFDGQKISARLTSFLIANASKLQNYAVLETRADGHTFLWQKRAWDSRVETYLAKQRELQNAQIANAEKRERIEKLSAAFIKGQPKAIQQNKELVVKYIICLLDGAERGDTEAQRLLKDLEERFV
jgi:hypothetical protein